MAESFEVTKTVYSILDFLEWQRQGTLNLRPYFQRNSVWSPKAKSQLIDTMLRGWPIPIIFLQMKTDTQSLRNVRQVVDGQQRLRTILSYVDLASLRDPDASDDFTIMRSHNRAYAGKAFDDLPADVRERFITTELSVHVLPSSMPDAELLQIFARLNSTGSKLNNQELRNAAFHGVFKQLAYELAYEQLDRWASWELFTPHSIALMEDVEFTSDIMLLAIQGVRAKTKASLDNAYRDWDDEMPFEEELRKRIRSAFDAVDNLLKPDRRGNILARFRGQGWMYTLFALVLAAEYGDPLSGQVEGEALREIQNVGVEALRRPLLDTQARLDSGEELPESLLKALRGAAADRASRQARIDYIVLGASKAAESADG